MTSKTRKKNKNDPHETRSTSHSSLNPHDKVGLRKRTAKAVRIALQVLDEAAHWHLCFPAPLPTVTNLHGLILRPLQPPVTSENTSGMSRNAWGYTLGSTSFPAEVPLVYPSECSTSSGVRIRQVVPGSRCIVYQKTVFWKKISFGYRSASGHF